MLVVVNDDSEGGEETKEMTESVSVYRSNERETTGMKERERERKSGRRLLGRGKETRWVNGVRRDDVSLETLFSLSNTFVLWYEKERECINVPESILYKVKREREKERELQREGERKRPPLKFFFLSIHSLLHRIRSFFQSFGAQNVLVVVSRQCAPSHSSLLPPPLILPPPLPLSIMQERERERKNSKRTQLTNRTTIDPSNPRGTVALYENLEVLSILCCASLSLYWKERASHSLFFDLQQLFFLFLPGRKLQLFFPHLMFRVLN